MRVSADVEWDFEYPTRFEKLDALYSKGQKLQWNGELELDWSTPIDPSDGILGPNSVTALLDLPLVRKLSRSQRETLNFQLTTYGLSQLLHGEQAALMACAKFIVAAPDYKAKVYGSSQAADEGRHIEVFRRYLHKCGGIQRVRESVRGFYDEIIQENWVNILILVQIISEGFALANFHNYRNGTREPLLRRLLEYVIRDEARHVAFGHRYAGQAIEKLHPDELEETAEKTFHRTMQVRSWYGPQALLDLAPAFQAADISIDDVAAQLVRMRKAGEAKPAESGVRAPIDPIADLIFPALDRIGAVTPRTREMFARERSVFAGRVSDCANVPLSQLELE
jgi:hypothetical protein